MESNMEQGRPGHSLFAPRESGASTNVRPNPPAKIDIRTTAKYGETILSGV